MQTMKFDFRFQATVVVKEEFLQAIIDNCRADNATPFLRKIIAEFDATCAGDKSHPDYNAAADVLTGAVCTNALRKAIQMQTSLFLHNAGHGARVSPVEVLALELLQPRADSNSKANPLHTQAVADDLRRDPPAQGYSVEQQQILDAFPPVREAQGLSQGAAVQALQDDRLHRELVSEQQYMR